MEVPIKLLAIAFLLLSLPTHAFTLLNPTAGRPLVQGWKKTVTVRLNPAICPTNVDLEGMLKDAVSVWNVVPASRLLLKFEGTTTDTTGDGILLIQCSTDVGDNNGVIGIGGAVYPNGPIDSGWVYMNASSGNANVANLARSTVFTALAHEMGHALGFGHSQDRSAIMYFAVGQRDPVLLAQDDVDGVNFLYNRDELGPDKMMGCASVGIPRSPSPGTGVALLALFLLPFGTLVTLRRQRVRVGA